LLILICAIYISCILVYLLSRLEIPVVSDFAAKFAETGKEFMLARRIMDS
jgi:hypothetical protein